LNEIKKEQEQRGRLADEENKKQEEKRRLQNNP